MLNPFFIQTQHLYQPSFLNPSNYSFFINPITLLTQQQAFQRDFSNSLLYHNHLQHQIQADNLYLTERAKYLSYIDSFKPEFSFERERELSSQCTSQHSEAVSTENSYCEVKESLLDSQKRNVKVEATKEGAKGENLKNQIIEILNFFLFEFSQANTEKINERREKFFYNQFLIEIFDALRAKYTIAAKGREDMIRFVIRKAITFLRDDIRDKQDISAKAASMVLCKKYFNAKLEDEVMKKANVRNEGDLLGFLLPYKKNSRNKTANSRFIKEIFGSEVFYQDYHNYLTKLEEILESENQKKIDKFTNFLVECVQKDSIDKIKEFRRLPWSQAWIQSTKDIAFSLPDTLKPTHTKSTIKDIKKLKQAR